MMTKPDGTLTSAQHEIVEVVWEHGQEGASVADIWHVIAARRSVGRTTILNLVDRLEKRGWLIRRSRQKPYRYLAALDREQTAALLAGGFLEDFFGGSASSLVMSLLGAKRLKPEEIAQLRRLLESASQKARQKRGK
jgi:predicted transcriptional regulator